MNILRNLLAFSLPMLVATSAFALNDTKKVGQVTDGVTVSEDVDYVITGEEPFATAGSVNITNTDHAVVIIQDVRPSLVIKNWLRNHVYIKGVQAENGKNCQVKMYAHGAIIMPYASTIKPLTVYSEQFFGGTSVNSFGLEHSGGFMNTLTDAKLNNKIRSFKLKRGYMVTFSTRKEGRGYSRCFIADKEDLEFSTLPAVLDQKISSYRVFQWYDAQKKGVHDTSPEANAALGTTWAFDWAAGASSLLPDVEWTSHHIYEDWPSAAACGSVTQTCHMQTNNEPGNSADDHPQDVATVLSNWENLMRTGMRLCSESSHDGSMGHLKAFIDSIDARGWRCDILDLHCYWDSGTFNNLNWYSDHYGNGRPIWISEWVWGASWNRNGAFAEGRRSDEATYNGTVPILGVLNSNPRVERYAYWNSEADYTRIWRGGKLTKLGEYYAKMNTGLGYNKANEFIPKTPPQKSPSNLVAEYDKNTKKVKLTWHDFNGEYNKSMEIQVRKTSASSWVTAEVVSQKEDPSDYELSLDGLDGYRYRVFITDLNGTKRYSNEAQAVNDDLKVGDAVSVGEDSKYLGGNMLVNGDFDLGLYGWENGKGEPLAAPYFEAVPVGSIDGGAYLQTYGNSDDKKSEQSIRKVIDIEPGTCYYVQAAGCNGPGKNQKITTTSAESIDLYTRVNLPAITEWAKQGMGFMANEKILLIQLRSCGGTSQFDKFIVSKLFDTQEEAFADALEWTKKRAEAFKEYNTDYPQLNAEMDQLIATATSYEELETGIQNAISAMNSIKSAEALYTDAETVIAVKMSGYEAVEAALTAVRSATTAVAINEAYEKLSESVASAFAYTLNNTAIASPSFASTTGWNTKSGTYQGGDQRTSTQAGKTCWNAWWSVPSTNTGTMAVDQQVMKLPHGFYALQAKASTQHYCVTDQHAFASVGGKKVQSPALQSGLLDIPAVADRDKWETLVTPYLYINDGDTLTIGFEGSKAGAVDHAWHKYGDPTNVGDNREGWWCATDFQLRQIPAYKKLKGESEWNTICLPYTISVPKGVELYQIVGITEDSTRICIEPAEIGKGGTPYIYRCTEEAAIFFESGIKASVAQSDVHGLRGNFLPTSKYAVGSLVLEGEEWKYVATTADRYQMRNYEGYIQKIPLLAVLPNNWRGQFHWTSGLVSEERIQAAKDMLAVHAGDANEDGEINVFDVVAIAEYVLNGSVINMKNADVNGDGEVNVFDIVEISNIILGTSK